MGTLTTISTSSRSGDVKIIRERGDIVQVSVCTISGKYLLKKILKEEGKLFYTLGNPDSYEEYLRKEERPLKLGRNSDYIDYDYVGGSIFRTENKAKKYLEESGSYFKVYGVVVDEKDVDFSKESINGFGDLLKDSLLISL